jgi:alanine-synthesizing transaminase
MRFAQRTDWNLAPNAFTRALDAARAARKPLLDLTASNPTTVGLKYDGPRILRALAAPASLTYSPQPLGLRADREAVQQYYAQLPQPAQISAEQVLLTASTSEAYSFIFRLLCAPGDEVLAPRPSYPLFDFLAGIHDVALKPYPLVYHDAWQLDFHSLERAITPRTRAIIVVHPNNPTGHFVSQPELAQLNALCSERGLALIADEVFLDYALESPAPFTFAAGSPGHSAALTFTMSGLSKVAGLPQMKLSWLVAAGPEALRAQAMSRLEVIADTYLSMSAPVQHAAAELLATRTDFQSQLRARLQANLAELDRQLAAGPHSARHPASAARTHPSHHDQPPTMNHELSRRSHHDQPPTMNHELSRPSHHDEPPTMNHEPVYTSCSRLHAQAGWYAVLRVPVTRSDEELAIALLTERSVIVHPGHFYDFESDGYLVVSLITPESDFREGMARVLSAMDDPNR